MDKLLEQAERQDHQDVKGQSIVSHITRCIGTLRTLSNQSKQGGAAAGDFVLFTHQRKQHEGKKLAKSYEDLREAVLELYLSVKIRTDDEIDGYCEDFFRLEKLDCQDFTGYDLVDLVKESIEHLMQMHEAQQQNCQPEKAFTPTSLRDLDDKLQRVCSPPTDSGTHRGDSSDLVKYEKMLQKLE